MLSTRSLLSGWWLGALAIIKDGPDALEFLPVGLRRLVSWLEHEARLGQVEPEVGAAFSDLGDGLDVLLSGVLHGPLSPLCSGSINVHLCEAVLHSKCNEPRNRKANG